ncbi:MAG: DUF4397 domain-containing protein, partial [Pseudomonadota bacterium]
VLIPAPKFGAIKMERLHAIPTLVIFSLIFSIGGCGSSDSSDPSPGFIQFINAIEDSPDLAIEVTDENDDTILTISGLAFREASSLNSRTRATYDIEVTYSDPDSGFDERLLSSSIELNRNTLYSAVLTGTFAVPELRFIERDEGDVTDSESEDIEVQVLNLSSKTVTTFLGDDSDGTASTSEIATVAAGNNTQAVERAFDDDAEYHLRLTNENDELVFDSDRINISNASRYTIVVTDATGPDTEKPAAFIVTDSGQLVFSNSIAKSGFIVLNAVGDSTTMSTDVEISATGDNLLSQSIAFTEVSALTVVDANFTDVNAVDDSAPGTTYSTTISLNEDTAYAFTLGGAVNGDDVSIRANEMDLRRVANAINIHFVNGLRETDDEDNSEVDFYALKLGDSLSDTAPLARGVAFLEGTSVIAGAVPYDFVVTTGSTLSILAGPTRIFPDGGDRIVVAVTEAFGGGEPYQVITAAND